MTILKAILLGLAAAVAVIALMPPREDSSAGFEFFLAGLVGLLVAAAVALPA